MGDGLFNKFKMLIGVEDAEDEEIQVVPPSVPSAAPAPAAVSDARRTQAVYANRSNTFVQPKMEHRDSKVVSMQNSTVRKQFKLVVTEPKSFDECPRLVDNLKSKKPVILNLEKLENETARKIFDFLSGATYALDGNVQKIANNIFRLCTGKCGCHGGGAGSGKSRYSAESESVAEIRRDSYGISFWRGLSPVSAISSSCSSACRRS